MKNIFRMFMPSRVCNLSVARLVLPQHIRVQPCVFYKNDFDIMPSLIMCMCKCK